MKEIVYEIKKLFQFRSIRIGMSLLFILNILNCFFQTSYVDNSVSIADINTVFRLASKYPAEINDMYANLQSSDNQEVYSLDKYNITDHLSNTESTEAFRILFDTIESISAFKTDVLNVIKKAESNLAELKSNNIDSNSYAVRLQKKHINIYNTILTRVEIGFEYSHGWDIYFSDIGRMLCSIAAVFLCSSVIFTHEYTSGFLPIILTTRYGRFKTSVAKQFCLLLASVFTVLCFSISSFIVIGLRTGYSSPYNVIQSVNIFRLCPFILSIGSYFLYSIIFQILVTFVFALFVSSISVITNRYAYIYLFGIGFVGLNIILYYFNYISYDNPLKWINFISSIFVSPLFYQYRTCNIFGYPISCQTILIVLYISFLFSFSILISWIYCRKNNPKKRSTKHSVYTFTENIINNNYKKRNAITTHSLSILFYESIKLFSLQKQWLLILGLLLIHIYINISSIFVPITFSEAVYKDYMMRYEGALSSDKISEIQKERSYINQTLSSYEAMRISYLNGTLSKNEYDSFLEEYRYASGRDEIFNKVENHSQYIEQLALEDKNAYFVYDNGWNKIIFSEFQWTLYAAILLVFSSTFSIEHDEKTSEGTFANILRCCKKGRTKTWEAKYFLSIIYTILLSLIWNSASILIIAMNYSLPLHDAPLFSLSKCYDLNWNLSILQSILIIVSIRILSITLFSIFTVTLSIFFKKAVPVLAVSIGTTLLPALFDSLEINIFQKLNFIDFLRATPSLVNHTYPNIFCFFLLITFFLIIYTKRSWIN